MPHTHAQSARWSATATNASTAASSTTGRLRGSAGTAFAPSDWESRNSAPSVTSNASHTSQLTRYAGAPDGGPPNGGIPHGTYDLTLPRLQPQMSWGIPPPAPHVSWGMPSAAPAGQSFVCTTTPQTVQTWVPGNTTIRVQVPRPPILFKGKGPLPPPSLNPFKFRRVKSPVRGHHYTYIPVARGSSSYRNAKFNAALKKLKTTPRSIKVQDSTPSRYRSSRSSSKHSATLVPHKPSSTTKRSSRISRFAAPLQHRVSTYTKMRSSQAAAAMARAEARDSEKRSRHSGNDPQRRPASRDGRSNKTSHSRQPPPPPERSRKSNRASHSRQPPPPPEPSRKSTSQQVSRSGSKRPEAASQRKSMLTTFAGWAFASKPKSSKGSQRASQRSRLP